MLGIRKTLRVGATVFGLSAVLLLVVPGLFLSLLGLESTSAPLLWSMRMIAVTLVALAGNMWLHAKHSINESLTSVAQVMAVAATGLGVLTLSLPGPTWFSVLYAAVGFLFGANYAICLLRGLR